MSNFFLFLHLFVRLFYVVALLMSLPHSQSVYAAHSPSAQVSCFTFLNYCYFSFFASFCLPIEFTVHAGFPFVFQSKGTEGSKISTEI